MEVYPAIDLFETKVVRLEQGDYARCKVYSEYPEEFAKKWTEKGAQWLHVVDLEGARSGTIKNWEALKKIVHSVDVSVQFGGGVRKREDVDELLRIGVKRVLLGTKALDGIFLQETAALFKDKISLSFDLRGDQIQIEGWLKATQTSVYDLLDKLKALPIHSYVVTDIERDGTLQGLNLEKIRRFLEKADRPVVLSGGVSSLEDIQSLVDLDSEKLQGVIVGKALYEGKIDLEAALRLARSKKRR